MKILARLVILLTLLGIIPGEFVFAQSGSLFNRFTKLDAFVLETGAGEAARKHVKLARPEREKKVADDLRDKAKAILGGPLKTAEENFIQTLASDAAGKAEPPAPVPIGEAKRPKKGWHEVLINNRRQWVWGWPNPDNPEQIMFIPGDMPK
jgi:hypothetical protein